MGSTPSPFLLKLMLATEWAFLFLAPLRKLRIPSCQWLWLMILFSWRKSRCMLWGFIFLCWFWWIESLRSVESRVHPWLLYTPPVCFVRLLGICEFPNLWRLLFGCILCWRSIFWSRWDGWLSCCRETSRVAWWCRVTDGWRTRFLPGRILRKAHLLQ